MSKWKTNTVRITRIVKINYKWKNVWYRFSNQILYFAVAAVIAIVVIVGRTFKVDACASKNGATCCFKKDFILYAAIFPV